MSKNNDQNLKVFFNKLDKLEKSLSDNVLQDLLNNLGTKWVGNIKQNFQNSSSPYPYGAKWPSLKAGGRFVKKGKKSFLDKSAKPLLDTGRLVNSINYNIKDNVLEIGTPLFYAQFHQKGDGVLKRAILPDRGLPISWKNDIEKFIEKVLKNLV